MWTRAVPVPTGKSMVFDVICRHCGACEQRSWDPAEVVAVTPPRDASGECRFSELVSRRLTSSAHSRAFSRSFREQALLRSLSSATADGGSVGSSPRPRELLLPRRAQTRQTTTTTSLNWLNQNWPSLTIWHSSTGPAEKAPPQHTDRFGPRFRRLWGTGGNASQPATSARRPPATAATTDLSAFSTTSRSRTPMSARDEGPAEPTEGDSRSALAPPPAGCRRAGRGQSC